MIDLTGTKFYIGKIEYVVDWIDEIGEDLIHIRNELIKYGKDCAIYHSSKVLKSGKKSKQTGIFYRNKTGGFIKIL